MGCFWSHCICHVGGRSRTIKPWERKPQWWVLVGSGGPWTRIENDNDAILPLREGFVQHQTYSLPRQYPYRYAGNIVSSIVPTFDKRVFLCKYSEATFQIFIQLHHYPRTRPVDIIFVLPIRAASPFQGFSISGRISIKTDSNRAGPI